MTTSAPVVIRRAEPRDLAALGKLGAILVRTHFEFDRQRFLRPVPGLEEGYGQFLGTQLRKRDVAVFVAERAGEVIGYVYGAIEPHSWKELRESAGFVHDVVVAEAARGAGVASGLIEAISKWFAERGAPRVLLWTAYQNAGAQRLFERLGFRRTMIEMTREVEDPHRD